MSFRHADSLKAWMRLSSSFCDAHTSHPCVTTGLTKAFNNRSLVMELTDLFSISSSTWPMSDHHRHTHGRSQLHLISTVAQAASFVVLLHRYTKRVVLFQNLSIHHDLKYFIGITRNFRFYWINQHTVLLRRPLDAVHQLLQIAKMYKNKLRTKTLCY